MIAHTLFPASAPARFNIVLVHGMVEHSGRYVEFAQFLSQHGGNVITFDIRGHGAHYRANTLGDFGAPAEGGLARTLDDIQALFTSFKNHLPNILLGHSMGSTIALRYAQTHTNVKQLVLTGVPVNPALKLSMAYHLARIEHKIKGEKTSLFDMNFVQFNKSFKPAQTDFDWLSTNPKNVANYLNDPLCGYPISVRYYIEMFDLMRQCFRTDQLAHIPKSTSVLMLWGADDPCTNFGKGTRVLLSRLQQLGLATAHIEYPKLRHEILNEDSRQAIYNDIVRLMQV